jgi:hypothetical protein
MPVPGYPESPFEEALLLSQGIGMLAGSHQDILGQFFGHL